jgi:hypothetical protein
MRSRDEAPTRLNALSICLQEFAHLSLNTHVSEGLVVLVYSIADASAISKLLESMADVRVWAVRTVQEETFVYFDNCSKKDMDAFQISSGGQILLPSTYIVSSASFSARTLDM